MGTDIRKHKIPCPNCSTPMDYASKTWIFCYRKNRSETKSGRSENSKQKIKCYKANWFQQNKKRIQASIQEKRQLDINIKNREYFYCMKYRFGLTKDEILFMYDRWNGCCEICGVHYTEQIGRKNKLNIDHSHTTGQVRGLLCHNCNLGLGNLKDSKDVLQKAIKYLERNESSNSTTNH